MTQDTTVALRRNTSRDQGDLASRLLHGGYVLYKTTTDTHTFPCGSTPAPKRQCRGVLLGHRARGHLASPSPSQQPFHKSPSPTAKATALFPFISHEKIAQSPSNQGKCTQLLSRFLHLDNQHRHGDLADVTHWEMKGLPSHDGNSVM